MIMLPTQTRRSHRPRSIGEAQGRKSEESTRIDLFVAMLEFASVYFPRLNQPPHAQRRSCGDSHHPPPAHSCRSSPVRLEASSCCLSARRGRQAQCMSPYSTSDPATFTYNSFLNNSRLHGTLSSHHLLSLVLLMVILLFSTPAHASQILLHAAANKAAADASLSVGNAAHSTPDWRFYHRTDSLLASISSLAANCPHAFAQRINLVPASATASNDASTAPPQEEVFVVTLGAGVGSRRRESAAGRTAAGAAAQSGSSSVWPPMSEDAKRRLRIMVSFGEHGREFISSEIALRLVEKICAPHSSGQAADASGGVAQAAGAVVPTVDRSREELLRELQRTELVLVPVTSAAGRRLAEDGRYCERGNQRGVDVNRNFGHAWGKTDSSTIPEEERPGRAAFSEIESRALHVLAMHVQPHVYISVHSGDHALVAPWDSTGSLPEGSVLRSDLNRISKQIMHAHCPQCRIGTSNELFGYRAYGTGVDFMHAVLKVPLTMTWEVYGDEGAPESDCMRMFNPLTREMFDKTVDTWANSFQTLSAAVHDLDSVKERLSAKKGVLSSSLLEDSWAKVASRLGSSSWTVSAYKAFIQVDNMPFTVSGRRRLKKLISGSGHVEDIRSLHGMRADGSKGLRGPHPVTSVLGALITLLVFSCMAIVVRHIILSRRPVSAVNAGTAAGPCVATGSLGGLANGSNGAGSTTTLSRRGRRERNGGSYLGDDLNGLSKVV